MIKTRVRNAQLNSSTHIGSINGLNGTKINCLNWVWFGPPSYSTEG